MVWLVTAQRQEEVFLSNQGFVKCIEVIGLRFVQCLFRLYDLNTGTNAFTVFYLGDIVGALGEGEVVFSYRQAVVVGREGGAGIQYFKLNATLRIIPLVEDLLRSKTCPLYACFSAAKIVDRDTRAQAQNNRRRPKTVREAVALKLVLTRNCLL